MSIIQLHRGLAKQTVQDPALKYYIYSILTDALIQRDIQLGI